MTVSSSVLAKPFEIGLAELSTLHGFFGLIDSFMIVSPPWVAGIQTTIGVVRLTKLKLQTDDLGRNHR